MFFHTTLHLIGGNKEYLFIYLLRNQNMHGPRLNKLIGDRFVHISLQACAMYSDFYICGNELFYLNNVNPYTPQFYSLKIKIVFNLISR